jgi:hypothetical protein
MKKTVSLQKLTAGLSMFLMTAVLAGSVSALDVGESKFYGYTWVRYTYEQEEGEKNENDFSIERVYLRWKMKLDDKVDSRITIQVSPKEYAQSKWDADEEDNKSIADWRWVLKDAYVDLGQYIPNGKIRIGLQKTYFGVIDKWDYPLIESDLESKQNLLSSRDTGVGIVGYMPAGFGEYALAVYNGTGYKHIEDNDAKAVCGSVSIIPTPGITLRASVYTGKENEDEEDIKRCAAVVRFAKGDFSSFIEGLWSEDGNVDGNGYSIFADYDLTEKLSVAGRIDKWDSNSNESGHETDRCIAGFNYAMAKNVLLQVNYQREDKESESGVDIWRFQTKFSW